MLSWSVGFERTTPMKITFVTPSPSLHGGYRAVAIYADRLRQRGHEVRIVARLSPPPSFPTRLRSLIRGRGWPRRIKPDTTYLDLLHMPVQILDQRRPVIDADVPDADVVIATWWETAEWVTQLSPRKGAKAYFLQDHEVFSYLPMERVAATWRMPFHKIVVSKWLATTAELEYGDADVSPGIRRRRSSAVLAPHAGRTGYPPSDLSTPGPPARPATSPRRPSGSPPSGSLDGLPARGLRQPRGDPGTPLAAGRGIPRAAASGEAPRTLREVRRLAVQLQDGRVRAPDPGSDGLPDARHRYPRSAAPELIADGGGILVAPDDPTDMARAIERLIALSEPEWVRISDVAFNTASRYSWDNAVELFEAALLRRNREAKPSPGGSDCGGETKDSPR